MGRPRNPARPARKPKKTAKTRAMGAVAQAAVAKMWAEIRQEFETTPASIRDLARKWGIKSHTTVLRRVQQEGWVKQPEVIAAGIATEGVITEMLDAESPSEPAQKTSPEHHDADTKIDHASTSKVSGNILDIAINQTAARPAKTGGRIEAAAEQRGAVRAAERMALVQQRQALREVAMADRILDLSARVIAQLQTMMESEDLIEVQRTINRLTAFGEDTESFSGLLRTAIMGIKEGVNLRRRAIGMDLRQQRNTSTDAVPVSAADLPEQVREMLPTLSTEELVELRKAAVLMGKKLQIAAAPEAVNTIDGLAEAILEGEGR
jgi:hypothetical protein